jgi:hypothetical protein
VYVTNSALYVKFKDLKVSDHGPYQILRLSPALLQEVLLRASGGASSHEEEMWSVSALRTLAGQ